MNFNIEQLLQLTSKGGFTKAAYGGFLLVFLITCMQANLGISAVWNSVPLNTAHKHQFLGVLTMASFILGMHLSRKINPPQIKHYLTKLHQKDGTLLATKMKQLEQSQPKIYEKHISKEYEKIKLL